MVDDYENKKNSDEWSFSIDERHINNGKEKTGSALINFLKGTDSARSKKKSKKLTLEFEKLPVKRMRGEYLSADKNESKEERSLERGFVKKQRNHKISFSESIINFFVDNIFLVGIIIMLIMAVVVNKIILQ